MFNAEGSFARKHLEKLGWADGRGLGAGQQGMSQAIRVKIKHDTTGVGHDPAKEFSDHWWDHVFHKAAASLVVKNGKDGAVVKKKVITQKERTETAKKALYGNFIKGHLLSDGTETQVEKGGEDTDSSDDETKAKVHTLLLPDDELFEKCGGRTAHKGARHGLKLNGKLARLQEQERHLAAKNHNSSSSLATPSSSPQPETEDSAQRKKKKKSKKRKREEEGNDNEDEGQTNLSENVNSSVSLVEGGGSFVEHSEDGSGDSKKKKKKRRKERAEERESDGEKEKRKDCPSDKESEKNEDTTQEDASVAENSEADRKKEKKKRKKERKEREREEKRRAELEEGEEVDESNVTLEANFPNIDTSTTASTAESEETNATKEKKKEKKKRKNREESIE